MCKSMTAPIFLFHDVDSYGKITYLWRNLRSDNL